MLSFIPDALLHLVVIGITFAGLGIYTLSFFTRFIPPLIPYSGIARIVGTVLIVCGIYFYGSYSTEMLWRNKVAELEDKVKVSEAKSKEANVQIQTVYKDRVKLVKDTQVVIQERIKEVEKRIDSQCTVDNSVIQILNDAAVRKPK
jgi:tRNA A37 threonylcarbamoyladenosine dehydratase